MRHGAGAVAGAASRGDDGAAGLHAQKHALLHGEHAVVALCRDELSQGAVVFHLNGDVGVGEVVAQALGHKHADGGLAHARHSHEHDVSLVQGHRLHLSYTKEPPRGTVRLYHRIQTLQPLCCQSAQEHMNCRLVTQRALPSRGENRGSGYSCLLATRRTEAKATAVDAPRWRGPV